MLLLGPLVWPALRRLFRERIDSASPTLNALHAHKEQTPTAGGLLMLVCICCALGCCGVLTEPLVMGGFMGMLAFGLLGFIDDVIKAWTCQRGLRLPVKLAAECLVCILWLASWLCWGNPPLEMFREAGWWSVCAPQWFPWIWGIWGGILVLGLTNAVNFTDGLDGLAAGCLAIASGALTLLLLSPSLPSWAADWGLKDASGPSALGWLSAALLGSSLGFLWFNRYPARVFMGDTGALAAGAGLAWIGWLSHTELLLIGITTVFLLELGSVILQIASFKLTGKRLFRCSPWHHHFQFLGYHESTIVSGLWWLQGTLAILLLLAWFTG
ncbi:MAG: phospho-N-acetylmuramoyl-pentapeptide-transferase [Planctomycetaceae bacterium]|nr:MAG: phospho-N-acetylmuramoyl-pentapeptide-transferase [Planctomycetaceae bacterium]